MAHISEPLLLTKAAVDTASFESLYKHITAVIS